MAHGTRVHLPLAAFTALLLVSARASFAQTGFGLLAKPFLGDTSYELDNATATAEPAGHEAQENGHFQLYTFQSDGRRGSPSPTWPRGRRSSTSATT